MKSVLLDLWVSDDETGKELYLRAYKYAIDYDRDKIIDEVWGRILMSKGAAK